MSNHDNDPSSIFDLVALSDSDRLSSVFFKAEMDSTNDFALQILQQASASLPAIVLTESQRAGRGRGDNQWVTCQGALTFSLVLKPHSQVPPTLLSLATGFSILKMIESTADLPAQIKWPNDVLVAGKKIAGILIESNSHGIVIGMGINVNNHLLLESATSLQQQFGKSLNLHEILSQQLRCFFETFDQAKLQPMQIVKQCEQLLVYLDEEIELLVGSKKMTGVLRGLDPSGGLKLETSSGLQTLHSATQIRPT